MFDSGVNVGELIDELQNEVDITTQIADEVYMQWLDSLQFLLYTEIIREQSDFNVAGDDSLWNLDTESGDIIFDIEGKEIEGEAPIRFEDIYTIYADKKQLIKSTMTNGTIFPYTYYKKNNMLCINIPEISENFRIVYHRKPSRVVSADNVRVPIEFIDLVKARLRGEAYKLANEGAIAANWLSEYNVSLEALREWVNNKNPVLGM